LSCDWLLYLDDLIDSAEKIGHFLQGKYARQLRDRYDRGSAA
jgi:hypothetical protein